MIADIAADEDVCEGQMTLEDYDLKQIRIKEETKDPYKVHVSNFTDKKIDKRKPTSGLGMMKIGE